MTARTIIAGTVQDITEREQANLEIREFQLAVENAMQGISRLDRDGHFVIVKREYAQMLGYQPEELLGRSWQITVPEEDHPVASQGCLRMLEHGRAEVECRAIRKDGFGLLQAALTRENL